MVASQGTQIEQTQQIPTQAHTNRDTFRLSQKHPFQNPHLSQELERERKIHTYYIS
jgi:hypothetical protein